MNVTLISVVVCIAGICLLFEVGAILRRLNNKPSKYRLIECYVDPAAYDRLQQMADEFDLSLPTFCSCCLECVDPVELAAAGERLGVQHRG
jgi:hypothetical protein